MEYLKKIVVGLLYGLGFGIGLYPITMLIPQSESPSFPAVETPVVTREKSQLSFQERKERTALIEVVDKGVNMGIHGPEYLASLNNNSDADFTWVYVKVDLFDQNDDFLYQCGGIGVGPLKSGSSINAKVICGGLNKEIYERHRRHVIFVSEGH